MGGIDQAAVRSDKVPEIDPVAVERPGEIRVGLEGEGFKEVESDGSDGKGEDWRG